MSRSSQIALSIPALAVILLSLAYLRGLKVEVQDTDPQVVVAPTHSVVRVAAELRPIRKPTTTTMDVSESALGNNVANLQARDSDSSLEGQEPVEVEPEVQPTRPTAVRLPIFEYHYSTFYFDGVMMKPEWLVEQLQWLADQGYYTLTIDELADFIEGKYAPPQPAVALTFDVGISHFDDYTDVVIANLRKFGLHGIFFIQTQGVLEVCDGKFTCWDSVAEWLEEGVISVGSHTVYHQDFTTIPPAQILLELRRSKEVIEERLGVTVVGVCYPFDAVNPEAFPILERLEYRFAVGGWTRSERSAHFGDSQPYNLPRYYPYSNDTIYPAMAGSGGLAFPELMTAAVDPTP